MINQYSGLYRGQVIENDDSEEEYPYYGAIKIDIPQIYGDKIPKDKLPWAYPLIPFGQGMDDNGHDYVSLNIPRINTWVWIMFEYGDPNRPVYIGGWIGGEESELQEEFKEDDRSEVIYPNIIGYKFGFDGGSFTLRIINERRLEIYFDENNIIEIDSKGDDPNEEPQIKVQSEWLVKLKSDSEIKLEAPIITIEAESELKAISGGISEIGGIGRTEVKGATIHGGGTVTGTFHHPRS